MNSIDWVLIAVLCIAFGVGYWLVGRLFTKYESNPPPSPDATEPPKTAPDQEIAAPPPSTPPSPLSKYQNAKRFGWDDRKKPKR